MEQEFSGMVSTHVAVDTSAGGVITVRAGSFAADESRSTAGSVVDRSKDAGDLSAKRTFLEVAAAAVGGIKGSPFIVAINENVKAPIFQVADVGIEADILDFLPELTEAIAAP